MLFQWKPTKGWPVKFVSTNVSQFGYTAEELISGGVSYREIVHPDDIRRVSQEVDKYSSAGVDEFTQEYRIVSPAGEIYWTDDRTTIERSAKGEITGYQGVVIDITERKQAEESLREVESKYHLAMEAVMDAVWDWNVTDGTVYYSPSWSRILGLEEQNIQNNYSSWEERIHPADKPHIVTSLRLHLAGESTVWQEEHRLRKADGDWAWVLGRGQVVERDSQGDPLRMIGTMTNIDERKQAEKEKEQLLNELLHSQKMESLGHLTGGIAHEFNNLLGVINGYTGLAITKCLNKEDEKLLQYMRSIETASGRATKLVSEMLAFGRSEQTDNLPLNISALILEDVNILRSTLPSTIEIKTKIDQQLPRVMMNPTQLNQILMNLFINARDAMDGVGKLTVRLHWHHGLDTEDSVTHKPIKGDWIELSVSDTGSGIEPEIINNIFNPFFTTKEVGKGTGMGLSIIYRIMEDHSGHILLDSEPGKGTTFHLLFLPIVNETTEDSNLAEELSEISEGDGSEILVVDDEEMLAVHMSELVKSYGYKAHYVTDSTEALNLFKQDPERFSILITDQTMPKMTGKDLIEKLRAVRPELPVIMCSGYSDKISSDESSELNFSYFSKKVDVGDIMREISNLLVLKN